MRALYKLSHRPSILFIPSSNTLNSVIPTTKFQTDEIRKMGQSISSPEVEKERLERIRNRSTEMREYAAAALEYFNSSQDGGKRYELLEHSPLTAKGRMIEHLEFRAKEKDCPSAQDETFYAQFSYVPDMKIDSCVCLGPSQELSSSFSRMKLIQSSDEI